MAKHGFDHPSGESKEQGGIIMAHHKQEEEAQCKDCKGTGIYVGMAERERYGVLCMKCKGTGKTMLVFEWDDFEGRVPRYDVDTVAEANPGITLGIGVAGGMPYPEWAKGEPFPPKSELRDHTCPQWWFQSADSRRKPYWPECGWGLFTRCKHFPNKYLCWERWDEERATR